jgi:hypothetical protein
VGVQVNLDNIAVSAKEKAEQEQHKAAEERAKALMAAMPRTPMNQLGHTPPTSHSTFQSRNDTAQMYRILLE